MPTLALAGSAPSGTQGPLVDALPPPPHDSEATPVGEAATVERTPATGRIAAGDYHLVTVKVVADAPYRRAHPHWRERARLAVEAADNKFNESFGIDLAVGAYARWASPDARSCKYALAYDLTEVPRSGKDIVIGFTGRDMDAGGCAYNLGHYMVVGDYGRRNLWIITRHESSHIFGAQDRYLAGGRPNPNHRDDIMEDAYDHPYWWSNERGDGDRQIIRRHAARFDG